MNTADTVSVELPFRAPMDFADTLSFLRHRALPNIERLTPTSYTRTVSATNGAARITVEAPHRPDALRCHLRLADPGDLDEVLGRVRHLLDLGADPAAINTTLGTDPALRPLLTARPGMRNPGAVDGFEIAVRAVVGQQVSVRGARTTLDGIVGRYGTRAFDDEDLLLFPDPERFAQIDGETLPMPRSRGRSLVGLARARAEGAVDLAPGADRAGARAALLALPGIGPWTADYIAMRALADPDILLASDLGVRKSAAALGVHLDGGRPDLAPWRSYLSNHLWAALG